MILINFRLNATLPYWDRLIPIAMFWLQVFIIRVLSSMFLL